MIRRMRPTDISPIGEDLAIKWDDGSESFIPLQILRQACPCAACKGEVDIMGNLHKNTEQPLRTSSFQIGARDAHWGLCRATALGRRARQRDISF